MTHKGYGMKRGMGEAIEGGEETAEKYFLGKLFFLLRLRSKQNYYPSKMSYLFTIQLYFEIMSMEVNFFKL